MQAAKYWAEAGWAEDHRDIDPDPGYQETLATRQDQVRQRFYVVFVGNLLDSDPGHQETLATRQDQVRQKFYIVFEGNLLNTGLGQ